MTLCPIAIVAGCAKCPVVGICPLKSLVGDAPKVPPSPPPRRGADRRTKLRRTR